MTNWQNKWNVRYHSPDYVYGKEPNAFLVESEPWLKGKNVLCVADGEGRNGVWLASKGYVVTSIDYSSEGLQKARNLAGKNGVEVTTLCADLLEVELVPETYNGIIIMYSHFVENEATRLFEKYKKALRQDGTIIFEAFSKNQMGKDSGGPKNIDLLYDPHFICESFSEFNIIYCKEQSVVLAEGTLHQGEASVIRLVAQKR